MLNSFQGSFWGIFLVPKYHLRENMPGLTGKRLCTVEESGGRRFTYKSTLESCLTSRQPDAVDKRVKSFREETVQVQGVEEFTPQLA